MERVIISRIESQLNSEISLTIRSSTFWSHTHWPGPSPTSPTMLPHHALSSLLQQGSLVPIILHYSYPSIPQLRGSANMPYPDGICQWPQLSSPVT